MKKLFSSAILSISTCALLAVGVGGRIFAAPVPPSLAELHAATPRKLEMPERLALIEKTIDANRQSMHIQGISLVIVKDDKVIYVKGLGLRDVEKKLPVTPSTLFAIGSATKAFTAMTVMMGVDDGKMNTSDSPKKYIPYFKLYDKDADSKITINDLLCHRSGLTRTDLAWYTGKLSAKETIEVAGTAKPTAKLGEKFQYQNVMFLAAGMCAAKAEKSPKWEELVTKRIFLPLGMKSTDLAISDMTKAADYSFGYSYDEKKKAVQLVPFHPLPAIAPAGAINSNANDMAQWVRLMLGGGAYEGKRLVSEKNFKELFVKRITVGGNVGYGYGWFLRDWRGHQVIEHGGNIDGFNSQVAFMPDQHLGFVLLTNIGASPLGTIAMSTVWENLVDGPSASASPVNAVEPNPAPVAAVDPAKEQGTYRLAEANLELIVALKEGKLFVGPAGQPTGELVNISGRKYKAIPPAPPDVFITFRPAKDNPLETEMYFEQAGAALVGKKKVEPKVFNSPITGEALMQKVIDATGGEKNWRKHTSMVVKSNQIVENQGYTVKVTIYSQAPNLSTTEQKLYAAKKQIATLRSYFNGKAGGSESTLSPNTVFDEKQIAETSLQSDFYHVLNWNKRFKSLVITGMNKVGEEEVYVLLKKPETSAPETDYISTKSFLVLKRDSNVAGSVPATELFEDYRMVDGINIPFRVRSSNPAQGDTITTVKEVKFGVTIPASVFEHAPVRLSAKTKV